MEPYFSAHTYSNAVAADAADAAARTLSLDYTVCERQIL